MDNISKGEQMLQWAKDLFPLCRSLTGQGTLDTLNYFKDINPELEILSFNTGEQIFDWQVPNEWNIRDAFLEHESGQRVAEFKNNNLHLLGYSKPIDEVFDREDILDHIFSLPAQPERIPYVTSYYSERWGFCMSHTDKLRLPAGKYRVFVDSDLKPGKLNLAHALLKGRKKKEIFFSSYVCHPSMANNELSGPVLLSALMQYVKSRYPDPSFSYRFVLHPETIGSIAYLSRYYKDLKDTVHCGFNLSCVGDERAYSHVQSRFGNNSADKALKAALLKKDNTRTYSFLERGADERQYCAPGIDLPLCTFCRSKYGQYPEYHTDADNFEVVTAKGLAGSFNVMKSIIDAYELGEYPATRILCEPQLGKRNLYPNLSIKGESVVRQRMDFLAYADGNTSIFEIASITGWPLSEIIEEYRICQSHNLIDASS
ncbi:MAG: DUF4910 domain-containing protein [Mariprofundaceae bacterium]|nr:DUF4910 domain-containing protein [Mariprofundaceae bacterium]